MAQAAQPRSLRFDERTEEQLKILSQLTGTAVSDLIRRFVMEGISAAIAPDALQKLIDDFNDKAATLRSLSAQQQASSAPRGHASPVDVD